MLGATLHNPTHLSASIDKRICTNMQTHTHKSQKGKDFGCQEKPPALPNGAPSISIEINLIDGLLACLKSISHAAKAAVHPVYKDKMEERNRKCFHFAKPPAEDRRPQVQTFQGNTMLAHHPRQHLAPSSGRPVPCRCTPISGSY